MRTSFFRFRAAWLPVFFFGMLSMFLASCDKEEDKDTTDYAARDEAIIQAYLTDNKLTGAVRDSTGTYVIITQPGTGLNAVAKQRITAKYNGTLLDGTVFDKSNPASVGFPFTLGVKDVIGGWDRGFTYLNKGSKAILLIPSDQAYGANSAGTIPGRSVLRFDVEVVDIK